MFPDIRTVDDLEAELTLYSKKHHLLVYSSAALRPFWHQEIGQQAWATLKFTKWVCLQQWRAVCGWTSISWSMGSTNEVCYVHKGLGGNNHLARRCVIEVEIRRTHDGYSQTKMEMFQ